MLTIEQIQSKVNEFISQLTYDRKPESLYEPISYTLAAGGKRIRPVLMLLAYNIYKDDPESILMTASGLETYHNFTLLHDDLMDNADVRRGRPTVHKKWDANTAILSGDTMLSRAFQMVASCPDDKLRQVIDCFTETTLEIDEGQQFDMDFENRQDVREEEYIEMIRLKTSVLLACALKIGAILGGASMEDQENLYNFGQNIGLAFQLQDDFLDVYGDEKVFGKAIGGDICNNKKTFMLINAQLLAEGTQADELRRWISVEQFDKTEKIQAVTRIYDELGIDKLVQKKMDEYYAEAEKNLQAISVSDEKKAELRRFAQMMMKRNK